jgi:hypothetical protein
VDLVFYGQGRDLEHDFIVAPGVSPNVIRMRFDGARSVEISGAGDLLIETGGGEVRFSRPVVYQTLAPAGGRPRRVEIAGSFARLPEGEIGFAIGRYDSSQPLVIDPVLSFSTYFGGTQQEVATAVAVDRSGAIWLTGTSISPDVPTAGGSLQSSTLGPIDGFLARIEFPAEGPTLAFSALFGGSGNDYPAAIALDSSGMVYVAGNTISGDFPVTGSAYQQEGETGDQNGFVIRMDMSLELPLAYSTYLGGPERDTLVGLAVDESGKAYVTGQGSPEFPMTANTFQGATRGGWEGIFSIVDTTKSGDGSLVYSTYIGGDSTDVVTGVALAGPNAVYLSGYTMSTDFPLAGAGYSRQNSGRGDAFLARLDWNLTAQEALTWSTYFGGTDLDTLYGLALDSEGRLHLAGYTFSQDLPLTAAAAQTGNAGEADIFVATIDPAQPGGESLLYATYLGGAGSDVPYKLALDASGALILAGYTLSTDFPIRGDSLQPGLRGMTDAFFLKIDPNRPAGQGLVCSSFLGGSQLDTVLGMALDPGGNVYLAGYTNSRDFPVTPDAIAGELPGFYSAFVTKAGPCRDAAAKPARAGDGGADGRNSRAAGRGR